MGISKPFALKMVLALVFLCLFAVILAKICWFEDEYTFLVVEESSLNALQGWPLSNDQLFEGVFVDPTEKALVLPKQKNLSGVRLGLFYSATSQGVEFHENLFLSRSGRAALDLSAPISFVVPGIDGEQVELVNNQARVVSGKLRVKKTAKDGTVLLEYGTKEIVLEPGQSWAELAVREPGGVKTVSEEEWSSEIDDCFRMGYPATRLAIANYGLWPKSGVKVGIYP